MPTKTQKRWAAGDEVAIRIGGELRHAQIVEDRGNLGVRGRQVVRIAVPDSDSEDRVEFELAEDKLERPPS